MNPEEERETRARRRRDAAGAADVADASAASAAADAGPNSNPTPDLVVSTDADPDVDVDPEWDEAVSIHVDELTPRLLGALGPVTPMHAQPRGHVQGKHEALRRRSASGHALRRARLLGPQRGRSVLPAAYARNDTLWAPSTLTLTLPWRLRLSRLPRPMAACNFTDCK